MKLTIEIEGRKRELEIRPMDESFIVHCKLWQAPLTRGDVPEPRPGEPAHVVREFFRRQIRTIGSCLILAWEGDGVVAKMHFTTREMNEAIGDPDIGGYCVDPDPRYIGQFARKLQALGDHQLERLMKSDSRVLRALCFNVGHTEEQWHGHGIAKAMLEYLKQWARERGWRRIEVRSCPDITPPLAPGATYLRRGALERQGFRVVEESLLPPEEARRRLELIEEYLAGERGWVKWHARNVHRLAADTAWRAEYDKNYVMGFDL